VFYGAYTAIITPFRGGKVDEKKLEELVDLQIKAGVQGIVPCGTTGESLYLSPLEQESIIKICVKAAMGKILVLPGTGSISTEETIALTQMAQKAGADGAVIITPWYIRPSQMSLYEHYKKINDNVDIPFIVYNNPARTGFETSIETTVKLASLKKMHGFKDCSPSLQRTSVLKQALGDRLSLLTGNDDVFAAHLGMGGDGGISIAPNVVPAHFVTMMTAWEKGDVETFSSTWKQVFPLISALFLESNPTTIKYAMSLVHDVSLEYRLPCVSLNPTTKAAIEKALQELDLWQPLHSMRER